MKCPYCNHELPHKLIRREVMSQMGRAKGPSKARDPEKMRQAVLKRWHGAKAK